MYHVCLEIIDKTHPKLEVPGLAELHPFVVRENHIYIKLCFEEGKHNAMKVLLKYKIHAPGLEAMPQNY
jgi:hypothetical protein